MNKYSERLHEIEARKAELCAEVSKPDTPTARIAQIREEAGALAEEEAQLRSRLELESRLLPGTESELGEGAGHALEQRAAEFRKSGRLTLPAGRIDLRSVTVASGQLATPTRASGINDNLEVSGSILSMANVLNAEGMNEDLVGYVINEMAADGSNEGESNASDPKFGYASIKSVTISTFTQVSREARKLSNVQYYERVLESARRALYMQLAYLCIVGGSGKTANFQGIKNSTTITADPLVVAAIDDKTLRSIALRYGGDDSIPGNAVLFLTKEDLIAFGDVRGAQDKKPVYTITPDSHNPNMGIIEDGGLKVPYSLCSKLSTTAKKTAGAMTMAYGNPQAMQVELFSDYTIEVQDNLKERMIDVLGEVMAGGNVVVHNGFVRVVAEAAGV